MAHPGQRFSVMVTLSMNFMFPSIRRSSGRHRGPQQKGAHLTEELGDLDQETTRDALYLARRRAPRECGERLRQWLFARCVQESIDQAHLLILIIKIP